MTEKLKDDIVTDDIKQVEEDKKVENVLNVEEDINAIFSGESLSEEFKTNAKAIFEAAIIAKVNSEKEKLEEEYSTKLQEEVNSINENLVTKVEE
jgi:SHS2 domain-containing protein